VVRVQGAQVREAEQFTGQVGQPVAGHVQPAEHVDPVEQPVRDQPNPVQTARQSVIVEQQRRRLVSAADLGRQASHPVRTHETQGDRSDLPDVQRLQAFKRQIQRLGPFVGERHRLYVGYMHLAT